MILHSHRMFFWWVFCMNFKINSNTIPNWKIRENKRLRDIKYKIRFKFVKSLIFTVQFTFDSNSFTPHNRNNKHWIEVRIESNAVNQCCAIELLSLTFFLTFACSWSIPFKSNKTKPNPIEYYKTLSSMYLFLLTLFPTFELTIHFFSLIFSLEKTLC